jgi:hypothetical protein
MRAVTDLDLEALLRFYEYPVEPEDWAARKLVDIALGRRTSAILSPASARSLCYPLVLAREASRDALLDSIERDLESRAAASGEIG